MWNTNRSRHDRAYGVLLAHWLHIRNRGVHFSDYPANLRAYLQEKASLTKICNPKWITEEVMSLLLDMLQVVPAQRKRAEEVGEE